MWKPKLHDELLVLCNVHSEASMAFQLYHHKLASVSVERWMRRPVIHMLVGLKEVAMLNPEWWKFKISKDGYNGL